MPYYPTSYHAGIAASLDLPPIPLLRYVSCSVHTWREVSDEFSAIAVPLWLACGVMPFGKFDLSLYSVNGYNTSAFLQSPSAGYRGMDPLAMGGFPYPVMALSDVRPDGSDEAS